MTLHATLVTVVSLTTASAAWIGPLQPPSRSAQSPAIAAQAPPPEAAPTAPPPSAESQAKGALLLTEARKALGGDDRLKAVKTLQLNGTFRRAAGTNTLEGDVEIFLEPPAKYRRNETTGVAGGPIAERTEVLNGTEVWDRNSGGIGFGGFGGFRGGGGRGRPGDLAGGQARGAATGAQPPQIDPERLREAQRRQRQAEVARLLLTLLMTPEGTVAWVGTAESPDGSADVVEVTPPQGAASRVFLETGTHMPLMITTTAGGGRGGRPGAGGGGRGGRRGGGDAPATGVDAPATAGAGDGAAAPAQPPGDAQGGRGRGPQRPPQAITIETHLSEYKSVSGIKLPHLVTRGVNGQTNEEWVVKTYKVNQTFKGNTFTQ